MNNSAIAIRLLALFANGGTLERAVTQLPLYQTSIERGFNWLKAGGRCSAAEIVKRAIRLREVVQNKEQAMLRRDFDEAANLRAEECKIYESFWLETPRGKTSRFILSPDIDEQIRDLAALLAGRSAPG